MRAQGKGNAACWDCRFYKVIDWYGNGTLIRTCKALGGDPIVITVMPMKCDRREKEVKK